LGIREKGATGIEPEIAGDQGITEKREILSMVASQYTIGAHGYGRRVSPKGILCQSLALFGWTPLAIGLRKSYSDSSATEQRVGTESE
jgi:hypothetical protein